MSRRAVGCGAAWRATLGHERNLCSVAVLAVLQVRGRRDPRAGWLRHQEPRQMHALPPLDALASARLFCCCFPFANAREAA